MEQIGYARVSTNDQDPELQIQALKKAGCKKIFTETVSGIASSRPELDKCFDYLRKGDTLIIYKLDRLGRSAKDIINITNTLQERAINLVALNDNIDTTTPQGKFMFQLTASLAELERNLISERTKDGLKAARARGRLGGRRKKLTEKEANQVRQLHKKNIMSIKEICQRYKISRSTLYCYLNPNKYRNIPTL